MRVVLTLAAATALLASCGGDGGEPAAAPQPIPTMARAPAPEIAGTSLEGEAISLGDFRGRPVVVNVWSSW